MSMNESTTTTTTRATRVQVQPKDFAEWVAPTLDRATRLEILEAIMREPNALVRILLNPDWDSCVGGVPTRYSLERVDSLPKALHATLLQAGRLSERDGAAYADRAAWRKVLGSKNAGGK